MVLVDTNVVSELGRPVPDAGVVDWALGESILALSVVTIEEVAFGFSRKPNPELEAWFESLMTHRCQVLPVDPAIARRSGELRARRCRAGRTAHVAEGEGLAVEDSYSCSRHRHRRRRRSARGNRRRSDPRQQSGVPLKLSSVPQIECARVDEHTAVERDRVQNGEAGTGDG